MDTAAGQERRIYEIAGLPTPTPLTCPFSLLPSLSLSLSLCCCPQQVVVLLNFCIVIYNLIDLCPRPRLYSDGTPFWRKVPFSNIGSDNGPAANPIYNRVLPPLDPSRSINSLPSCLNQHFFSCLLPCFLMGNEGRRYYCARSVNS